MGCRLAKDHRNQKNKIALLSTIPTMAVVGTDGLTKLVAINSSIDTGLVRGENNSKGGVGSCSNLVVGNEDVI